jgi:hypothetical protein
VQAKAASTITTQSTRRFRAAARQTLYTEAVPWRSVQYLSLQSTNRATRPAWCDTWTPVPIPVPVRYQSGAQPNQSPIDTHMFVGPLRLNAPSAHATRPVPGPYAPSKRETSNCRISHVLCAGCVSSFLSGYSLCSYCT